MDQQNNHAVPGSGAGNRQPENGPAPVWEGAPQKDASYQEPEGWGTTPAVPAGANAGTGWGAPKSYSPNGAPGSGRNRTWTAKKGMVAGGVAVVVAAAAGAGAYAAANGSSAAAADGQGAGGQGSGGQGFGAEGQFGPGSQGGMTGPGAGAGMDGGPSGLGMGMAGLNAAIHSEYVILQDSGYVTMAGQAGTVTSVSANSLTVKSDDGFSRTYAVDSDVQVSEGVRQRGSSAGNTLGLSAVTTGASVRVSALKESDSYRAETIQLTAAGTSSTPNSGTSSTPSSGVTTN